MVDRGNVGKVLEKKAEIREITRRNFGKSRVKNELLFHRVLVKREDLLFTL